MVVDTTLVVVMTVRPKQGRKCETALIDMGRGGGWILDTGEGARKAALASHASSALWSPKTDAGYLH